MSTKRVVAATRDANNNQIIIGDLVHFIFEGIYGTKGHEKKIIYAISGMSFNMVKVTTTSGRKRTWNIPSNTVVIINTASARELLVREQSINDRKKNRSLASKTSNKGSHKIEKP